MTGRFPSNLSAQARPRLRSVARPLLDGLTLVEVLIALTLVAVVLLPVMIALSQALVATSESTITAAATSIARDRIEQIKDLTRRQGFDFNSLTGQPREPADLKPGDHFFELDVTVETIRPDDNLQSGLKKAVVTVYRRGSETASARVTTYFAPYGI
ncbi:MAG: prepilin-type N-terminal cleavage/methylation domain-containing protein [Armatimonadota bacterium]